MDGNWMEPQFFTTINAYTPTPNHSIKVTLEDNDPSNNLHLDYQIINASNTNAVIITNSARRRSRIPSFDNHASQRLSHIHNNLQNVAAVHGTAQQTE